MWITMDGRDPAWSAKAMGQLFGAALERNLTPLQWEIGLFVLRDLEKAKDPGFKDRPWKRTETFWGCPVKVVGIQDDVVLLVAGTIAGREGNMHRLEAKEL